MNVRTPRRWPLLVACAFAVLFVAGQLVVPAPPAADAKGTVIVAYYRDHASAIRWSVWLTTLAGLAFVPVMAGMRRAATGLGRDVLLLGAASVLVATMIWTWISAALAYSPGRLDPSVATTMTALAAFYGPTLTVSVILLAAPLGWSAHRSKGMLPRWLAPVTAVLVAEQLVETLTIFGRSGFLAPGGPMNLLLGAGLFVAWVIAAASAITNSPTTSGQVHAATT